MVIRNCWRGVYQHCASVDNESVRRKNCGNKCLSYVERVVKGGSGIPDAAPSLDSAAPAQFAPLHVSTCSPSSEQRVSACSLTECLYSMVVSVYSRAQMSRSILHLLYSFSPSTPKVGRAERWLRFRTVVRVSHAQQSHDGVALHLASPLCV